MKVPIWKARPLIKGQRKHSLSMSLCCLSWVVLTRIHTEDTGHAGWLALPALCEERERGEAQGRHQNDCSYPHPSCAPGAFTGCHVSVSGSDQRNRRHTIWRPCCVFCWYRMSSHAHLRDAIVHAASI